MRAIYALTAAIVVVSGCDLLNEPVGPMVVTITGPETAVGERTTNAEGASIVQCQVQLEASAEGGDEWSAAIWTGAFVEWTDLETGEVQQEATWDGQTVAGLWDTPQLRRNQTRTSSWLFWSYAPFQLDATFTYHDSAMQVQRSESYSLTCE